MRTSRCLVLLNTVLIGAVAAYETAGGDAKSFPDKRAATIQYWAHYCGTIGDVEEKRLAVFKARFPRITVERTFVGAGTCDNLLEKATTSFASGTSPHASNIGSSGIATYAPLATTSTAFRWSPSTGRSTPTASRASSAS